MEIDEYNVAKAMKEEERKRLKQPKCLKDKDGSILVTATDPPPPPSSSKVHMTVGTLSNLSDIELLDLLTNAVLDRTLSWDYCATVSVPPLN